MCIGKNTFLAFYNLTKYFQVSLVKNVFISFSSKQHSFGKLNIPKPNSVTSERRTSFFGPRYANYMFQKCDVVFIREMFGVYFEYLQHEWGQHASQQHHVRVRWN